MATDMSLSRAGSRADILGNLVLVVLGGVVAGIAIPLLLSYSNRIDLCDLHLTRAERQGVTYQLPSGHPLHTERHLFIIGGRWGDSNYELHDIFSCVTSSDVPYSD